MYDLKSIRSHFPALQQKVNNKTLVYLDSAATTLKPDVVPDAMGNFYRTINSNVHRGVHTLSQKATNAFEDSREFVKQFINAASTKEIIFTKGATESINLVTYGLGEKVIGQGDEILISALEHHANLIPWQQLCARKGGTLKIIPVDDQGNLEMDKFPALISDKTKLIALSHISNTLGSIIPVKQIVKMAHEKGVPVLIDGAQGIVHENVDVQDLDCDFYAFSGHKLYGPMGVGVLYGKEEWLEKMDPFQTGGSMIKDVSFDHTTYAEIPAKFEPGTPDVAGVIGLEAAIRFLEEVGLSSIHKHESEILEYATERLKSIENLKIIGEAKNKSGIISYVLEGLHHYDAGTILDQMGVAVRTGKHCTQPLLDSYNLTGTIRASFGMYTSPEEIDILYTSILRVNKMFL